MADLTTIRNALASQINEFTGLRVDGQARDSVNPPCAVILPGAPLLAYGKTMDGAADMALIVLLIISDAAPVEMTQRALDAYLGIGSGETVSIPDAITSDPSLGGIVHWAEPVSAGQYGRIEYSGVTYFGARIDVTLGVI
jgi:hypothetical protein